MLKRIVDLVRQILGRKVKPAPREYAAMRHAGRTAAIGDVERPVYLDRGSKQPHILAGSTFVPLSVFKR